MPVGRADFPPRGLSLVEVLVGASLLALVMVLLFRIFVPGLTIWKTGRAEAEMEQQAMLVESHITASLLGSHSDSITVLDEPELKAISMLGHGGTEDSPGYDDITGRPIWREVVIYSLRPSRRELIRTVWRGEEPSLEYRLPTDSEDEPFALDPAGLRTLCDAPQLEHRVLSRSAEGLALERQLDSETWRLTVKYSTSVPSGVSELVRELELVPRMRSFR